jgi:ABC-type phosphate/phosphonate transport system permease subunit
MGETGSILVAMILLVALVDLGSYFTRRALSR